MTNQTSVFSSFLVFSFSPDEKLVSVRGRIDHESASCPSIHYQYNQDNSLYLEPEESFSLSGKIVTNLDDSISNFQRCKDESIKLKFAIKTAMQLIHEKTALDSLVSMVCEHTGFEKIIIKKLER